MLRSLAGLTTRGRCLIAAGIAAAVCSVVLNERDLLRIAIFVIALPLLIALFIVVSRVRISCRRSLLPERVTVGSSSEVQLSLWRTGRLPASEVLLEDGVGPILGSVPRFVVERLPRSRAVALRYPIEPSVRGIQQVGPLRATITDPFGLCEFHRELVGMSRLTVTPKIVTLSGLPGGAGSISEGNTRLHSGHGDADVLVRQYRHGDDLRKVHWRSTAHRGEIMVRLEERPSRGGTTVLLDRRAAAHHGTGANASLEWAISFAASVSLHLRRSGRDVRLVSEHARVIADAPSAGGEQCDNALLDALAALQPAHERDVNTGHDPADGQELIAVLGTVSNEGVHELNRYRPRGVRSLAVLLDTPGWSAGINAPEHRTVATEESARLLRAAGWLVVIAGPRSTINRTWWELNEAAGRPGTLIGRLT